VLYEMTKEPGVWHHSLMIDVAVERLVQSEDELRHGARPPSQGFQIARALCDSLKAKHSLFLHCLTAQPCQIID
jgi:hypothetical protein